MRKGSRAGPRIDGQAIQKMDKPLAEVAEEFIKIKEVTGRATQTIKTYRCRDQHQGRALSAQRTQRIYAPETVNREHSFCARQHLIFVTTDAKNDKIFSALSYNFKSALTSVQTAQSR